MRDAPPYIVSGKIPDLHRTLRDPQTSYVKEDVRPGS